MSKKKQNNVFETSQNYILSILDNFDDKYKKRVARYLYRSVRKLKNKL